ncbi:MAG: YjjG family noncanonical pyrimidine nucleotidase [Erysipelotrichaceae bacterium]|nr:YjjG family noncanonical pyrimidine nucleotidase [Erysipelotrichaceae bacterium]
MYKVVLWDVDRTLLDFDAAQGAAIKTLFKEFNLGECSDEMLEDYDHINHKYWGMLERKEITKPEVLLNRFVEFFNKYNLHADPAVFNKRYQNALGDTIVFYPNVLETLNHLKDKGIKQYAITNGTKAAQDKKLSRSGLINILDGVYISDVIKHEKPSLEFFEPVLNDLKDYSKEEMLIVGDSLSSDIKGANNVGIKGVWFNFKSQTNNSDVVIDYEIKDIKEVIDIVEGN